MLAFVFAAAEVLAAYIVVDLISGLYHLATDRGLNVAGQVQLFQEHHRTNTMVAFDWQPMVVALPALPLALWLESSFLIAAASFGMLAQVPHYYAHRRSQSGVVQRIVRFLQRTGLIITPQHHAAHHRGEFDRNFCVVSGWNNWWLNLLLVKK